MRRGAVTALLALVFGAFGLGGAVAQDFPTRPVKILVPFPPGGGVDALGRIVQPGLQQRLGQPVVVENKPGAAGTIGVEYAINQPRDGYTVLIGAPGAISVAPGLNRGLAYNPAKDLAPVTMGVKMPNLLVVHPNVKAGNVAELVASARAEPGKLTFASGGIGTGQHLSGELLKITAKIDILHVPYKGTAPALADLVAGQVSMSFTDPSVMEQVRSGRLRLMAQSSAKRSPLYPDTPTVAESGVADFDSVNWYAFFVAAGVPADITQRLQKELAAVLTTPDVAEKLRAQGMNPEPSTSEDLGRFVAEDTARWTKVIQDAGIKAE